MEELLTRLPVIALVLGIMLAGFYLMVAATFRERPTTSGRWVRLVTVLLAMVSLLWMVNMLIGTTSTADLLALL